MKKGKIESKPGPLSWEQSLQKNKNCTRKFVSEKIKELSKKLQFKISGEFKKKDSKRESWWEQGVLKIHNFEKKWKKNFRRGGERKRKE